MLYSPQTPNRLRNKSRALKPKEELELM